jgi:hypothetical protein
MTLAVGELMILLGDEAAELSGNVARELPF